MSQQSRSRDVNRYYDFLYLWSQVTSRFRAFATADAYAIHRPLLDAETGEYSDRVVHRLIRDAVAGMGSIDALDAGCGYGGTCLDLSRTGGSRWLGITINKRQHRMAQRHARALGLDRAASFALASYDEPLSRSFNLVVGIESLIHSPAPARTIANLACHLRPQGRFIIVDDMLVEPLSSRHAAEVVAFKRLWRCPVMPTIPQWAGYLEAGGCTVERIDNISRLMWHRTEAELASELAAVSRLRWRNLLGLRMVADAQKGGLLLERLILAGASRYIMMVARKR